MTTYKTATPVKNALVLLMPDERMRAGFNAWLAANSTKGGSTFFLMQSGKNDRILFANNLTISINAERDLRTGKGFTYVNADGKKVICNLSDIGMTFTRHHTIDAGVYGYPTITAESTVEKRYDTLMGRTATAKAVKTPVVAKPATVAPKVLSVPANASTPVQPIATPSATPDTAKVPVTA